MKYNDIFRLFSANQIPLADIKTVFDGYFMMPFDSLGIHGEEDKIQSEEAQRVLALLKQGYPAVYLAGYTEIGGLRIFVNEDVLIPRIETEDFIYTYIRDNYDFNHKKILDLCTGSGFIALALKKIYPTAEITASDISEKALTLAKKSASYNNLDIHFVASDFLTDIRDSFDVIVSNPPYIEEESKEVQAPFEPALALFSGKDGLNSYRSIFRDLNSHLNPNGFAFFECESTNTEKTLALFKEKNPCYDAKIIQDIYQKNRYLITKKN